METSINSQNNKWHKIMDLLSIINSKLCDIKFYTNIYSPVEWGCRIPRLYLRRGVRPNPKDSPGYDNKQCNYETPVQEILAMKSTTSLQLYLSPLWAGDLVPVSVRNVGRIELFNDLPVCRKNDCCIVSWGCIIHWLHLCGEVQPSDECPVYDTKQADREVPLILELLECREPLYRHRSQLHSGPKW